MSRLTQYSSAAVRWRAALSMSREWVVVVATSWRAAAMVAASSSRRRGRRMGVMRWLVGRSDMRGPLFEVGDGHEVAGWVISRTGPVRERDGAPRPVGCSPGAGTPGWTPGPRPYTVAAPARR